MVTWQRILQLNLVIPTMPLPNDLPDTGRTELVKSARKKGSALSNSRASQTFLPRQPRQDRLLSSLHELL